MALKSSEKNDENMGAKQELSMRLTNHPQIQTELVSLFKTDEAALSWLKRPIRALNNKSPLSILNQDAEKVRELINRIRTGDIS